MASRINTNTPPRTIAVPPRAPVALNGGVFGSREVAAQITSVTPASQMPTALNQKALNGLPFVLNGDCGCNYTVGNQVAEVTVQDLIWVGATVTLPAIPAPTNLLTATGLCDSTWAAGTAPAPVPVRVTLPSAYRGYIVGMRTSQAAPGVWGISQLQAPGASPNMIQIGTTAQEIIATAVTDGELVLSSKLGSVDAREFYTKNCECCCLNLGCIDDRNFPSIQLVRYPSCDMFVEGNPQAQPPTENTWVSQELTVSFTLCVILSQRFAALCSTAPGFPGTVPGAVRPTGPGDFVNRPNGGFPPVG